MLLRTMNFKAVKTCLLFARYTCRIFQFEDFKRTKKRVLEEEEIDGAMVKKKCSACNYLKQQNDDGVFDL